MLLLEETWMLGFLLYGNISTTHKTGLSWQVKNRQGRVDRMKMSRVEWIG